MKKVLLGLAGIMIASPAHADWQYAKWGATPDAVIAASGGKAQPIPVGERSKYDNGLEGLVSGTHTAGSRTFAVKFVFRENRLVNVHLALKYTTPSECYALETDLTGLYGNPLSKSNGSGDDMLSRKWADRQNNNQIAFFFATFSSDACFIDYSPINSAQTEGL